MSTRQQFDWRDAGERAFWTAVQVPAAVAVLDFVAEEVSIPATALLVSGGLGFALSFVKTIGAQRLEWLAAKRVNP